MSAGLDDLADRIISAEAALNPYDYWESMEQQRIRGKKEGLRLALSYVEETQRIAKQQEVNDEAHD